MKKYSRNNIIYFYSYFVAQLIFIFVHSYLPFYFYDVINVNKSELAFVQIIPYSALLIKPFISIYFNNLKKVRVILIFSAVGIIASLILIIFSLELLILFGIFLGINFIFIAFTDVAVDKILVEESESEKEKARSSLFLQIGAASGAIMAPVLYLSSPSWSFYFLMIISLTLPIIFFMFFLIPPSRTEKIQETELKEEPIISVKNLLLMGIFIFFIYGDKLYEYPLEPWVENIIGDTMFSILLIILIAVNVVGIIIAGFFSHKLNKQKLLIYSAISSGILVMIAPFTNIVIFTILFAIIQIFAGFLLVNVITLMIDISKKKVVYFQIMAVFSIFALILFIPLGTYLSDYIATEWIIFVSGVIVLVSIVPMWFIKAEK